MFDNLIAQFGALVGFASVVSLIVNILKTLGIVKDGTADKWVAVFNFLGVATLFVLNLLVPEFDVMPVDSVLGQIAVIGGYLFSFIVTLLGSKLTYFAVKGLPLIGKSNSG